MTKVRTAVLISGRGSNMMALLETAQADDYPADIALVISNRPEAEGLRKADAAGVMAIAIDHKDFESREAFERELDAALREHQIEFVACAGFMRVLTDWFVSRWQGRLINIHPSLLPKYKGLHTHKRAIEAGDAFGGASVHWVVTEVDGGEVIDQEIVEIDADETQESLAAKVLERELILYPRALAKALNMGAVSEEDAPSLPRPEPEIGKVSSLKISHSRRIAFILLFSFFVSGVLEVIFWDQADAISLIHGVFIVVSTIFWCTYHAEENDVILPRNTVILCIFLPFIAVPFYLFRRFGFKVGGFKVLQVCLFLIASFIVYFVSFTLTDLILG